MSIGRIALILSIVGFAAFGVPALLWPAEVVSFVGIELPTPAARSDVRAVYGGMQLGLAAFLAYCAAKPERTALGLAATTTCIVGLATARGLGAIVDGEVAPITLVYLSVEAGSAAIAAAALWFESAAVR